jgi:hypothetical protein
MMAVECWRQGTSQKVYNLCTFLGLSQGANAARARVDKLVLKHDDKIKEWKSGIEVIKTRQGTHVYMSIFMFYFNFSLGG